MRWELYLFRVWVKAGEGTAQIWCTSLLLNIVCLCSFEYCFAQLEDKQLALPSMEEQAAIEGNPTKLQTWTYKPANALMYVHRRRKIIVCSFVNGKFTEITFLFLDLRSSNDCLCNFFVTLGNCIIFFVVFNCIRTGLILCWDRYYYSMQVSVILFKWLVYM